MQLAVVIGSVWSTRKDERLRGEKLMIIKPINLLNEHISILPIIAIDTIGAGIGEIVLVVNGSTARSVAKDSQSPVDAAIIGIVDNKEVDSQYL